MESNLYEPPKSELGNLLSKEKKRMGFGNVCAIISMLLLFSLYGVISTAYSFYEIFQSITLTGTGDPKIMAGNISQALVPIVLSLFISIPGLFFALLSIYFSSYRSRLVFKVWIVSSVLLFISFPFGSVFGLFLAVVLFIKRRDFSKAP